VADHDLAGVSPDQLARMLDVSGVRGWSDSDAAVILRHQLDAPLLPELAQLPGVEMGRLSAALPSDQSVPSLLGTLTCDSPPTEILEAIKSFARHLEKNPDSPLQGGPAAVIYYAALAAAALQRKQITQLSRAEMEHGFGWAMDQPGADGLRQLFEAATNILES
jgi:hypothetical protein